MIRYIDANRLLEYIGANEHCKNCLYNNNDCECRGHSLSRQDICNIVEDLVEETADVKPVVRGEWTRHYTRPNVFKDTFWHCSVCGYKNSYSFANFDHKFCPNCGARMGEE